MYSLGSRLKEAREKLGLRQNYTAKKLGISASTLSGYENDYREPDAEILNKMADLYDCTIDYLMGRTDNPKGGTFTDQNEKDLQEIIKESGLTWGGKPITPEKLLMLHDLLRVVVEERLPKDKKDDD